MNPKKLTDDEIQSTLTSAVKAAVDFVESEVAPDRIKAQKYFNGAVELSHEEGRSKVVATKCRDTIRAIKPALMRVFLQSDKPVEFIPRTAQAAAGADQATNYAKFVFERNHGFRVLHDAFHDALIKKVGIVKFFYDEIPCVEIDEYSGLSDDQYALIIQDPEIEVLEHEETVEASTGPDGLPLEVKTHSLKVSRTKKTGDIKIDSVAPEDFFVDRSARRIDDCYVCGHTTEGRVGDLVEMGFDFDEVYDLGGVNSGTADEEEEMERRGHDDTTDDENPTDPSMRKVMITEAYMKMDIEGTGVPRLYKFLCAGQDHKVLEHELCDHIPFAVFEVDPEPHTFFGRSLVDIITDDQDASTSLLRGLLDSIAMANNPRMAVVDNMVNMDDALNGEIGAVIRVKDINALREITLGTGASAALPAIQHYDEVIRAKTGVTGAAMGMDADVLQSQTAQGVNAAVQAAAAVSELIARMLAEGGMRQLFKGIAALARQHPDAQQMMRVDGQFIPVDPRSWSTEMDVICNVGLGTGKHEEKMATLMGVTQFQAMVFQAYGPTNGLVSMTNIRNAQADLMRLGGIHNVERYLMPMDPQREQQLMQAQAQAMQGQQQASDPNAAFLQAEQMKTSARVQADQQKAQLDFTKAQMDDDRQRDKMLQDLVLEAAKIAQKGQQVNAQQVLQAQRATQPGQGPQR